MCISSRRVNLPRRGKSNSHARQASRSDAASCVSRAIAGSNQAIAHIAVPRVAELATMVRQGAVATLGMMNGRLIFSDELLAADFSVVEFMLTSIDESFHCTNSFANELDDGERPDDQFFTAN